MTSGGPDVPGAGGAGDVPERWARIAEDNLRELASRFAALADPFRAIQVNPRDIREGCAMHAETRSLRGSKYHDWGRVVPGDWDLEWKGRPNPRLWNARKWRAVRRRFLEGVRWEDTGIIDSAMETVARKGYVAGGLTTRAEVLHRYERLDGLFERIKAGGFVPSHEVEDGDFDSNLFVSIGRDGRLLRAQHGNHRLAIVTLLGLPRIPVYVLSRHEKWQETRERVLAASRAKVPPPLTVRHPDLEDFGQ